MKVDWQTFFASEEWQQIRARLAKDALDCRLEASNANPLVMESARTMLKNQGRAEALERITHSDFERLFTKESKTQESEEDLDDE